MPHLLRTVARRIVHTTAVSLGLAAAAFPAQAQSVPTNGREVRDARRVSSEPAEGLPVDRALRLPPRPVRDAGLDADPRHRPPPLILTPRDRLEVRRFGATTQDGDPLELETRLILRDNDSRHVGERRIGAPTVNHGATRQPSLQGRRSDSPRTVEGASFQFQRSWED